MLTDIVDGYMVAADDMSNVQGPFTKAELDKALACAANYTLQGINERNALAYTVWALIPVATYSPCKTVECKVHSSGLV